jgi:hypothetical protein
MGAFGGGMIPVMLDAGIGWIVGSSVVGFLFVSICVFGFNRHLTRVVEFSDKTALGAFLFDPTGGFVPGVVGGASIGLLLAVLEKNGWLFAIGLLFGVCVGTFYGTLAVLWRALFHRDSSADDQQKDR